ncbi:hypothetical protein CNR22_16145 [Sphingobacteriaceae bacterium]|nr:hypothetical protein CNR22_16145 [Sphingobacteriaceae bacterium]
MLSKRDKIYAARLKQLRETNKIKQFTLACSLNLSSQQQYSDLENGKKHFSDQIILRICEVFQLGVTDFINTDEQILNFSSMRLNSSEKKLSLQEEQELKLWQYKKMLLESKLENIALQMKLLSPQKCVSEFVPGKTKVHVLL